MFATLLGATLRSEAQTGMTTLDSILATDNLKRNLDKGEALVQHRGRGQMLLNSALTKIDEDGKVIAQWPGGQPSVSAKHLGTYQHINNSHTTEQRRRCAAAREGYSRFSRYFSKGGVLENQKVTVFTGICLGTLTYGTEARGWSRKQLELFNRTQVQLSRRLRGRQGYGKIKTSKHRPAEVSNPQTDERILLYLNHPTASSQISVYRLRWLKTLCFRELENPDDPPLVLVAVFGEFPPHLAHRKGAQPIDEDGVPTEHACSLLKAFFSDLRQLLGANFRFKDGWGTVSYTHLTLPTNREV